jgi:hypothetical protein
MKKHLNLLLFINTNFMDVDDGVLLYNNDLDIFSLLSGKKNSPFCMD